MVMWFIICFIEEARRERNTVESTAIWLNLRYVLVTAVRTLELVSFQRLSPTGTQQTTSDRTQYWRYVESCRTPHHAHLRLVNPVPGPLLMRGRVKYRYSCTVIINRGGSSSLDGRVTALVISVKA